MAKLNVNIGLSVNDKTGDTLRTAFDKINQNFTELYTLTGGTSTALTELAQDYAAPMFNHANHTNITVTYDDASNKILLTGVAAQVQSNWTATTGLGVILNKPTIPTSFANTGDFTFTSSAATVPVNTTLTLTAFNNTTKESKLTLSPTTTSSLYAANNLEFGIGYGTGFEKYWLLGADGSLRFPDTTVQTTAWTGSVAYSSVTGTPTIPTSFSSLVNSTKTVSLASTGILSLPAQAVPLTTVSQITSATINRTGASIDTEAIAASRDTWLGIEQTFTDIRDQDEQTFATGTRPWVGLPSWEAYPLIQSYTPPGASLPPTSSLIVAAATATTAYLAYKELVSNIDIVSGNQIFSFENSGTLRVPGVITKDNNLALVSTGVTGVLPNGMVASVTADGQAGRVFIRTDSGTLRTWQFDANGVLTLPGNLTLPSGAGINTGTDMRLRSGTGAVTITTNYEVGNATPQVWQFGNTGTLQLPLGGVIAEGGGLTGAIKLTPAGGANANQALLIYPTAAGDGDHVHLTAGGGATELYLGDDSRYVKLVNGGNIEVRATTTNASASASWTFGTDGAISTTDPLIINVPNGVPTGVGAIAATTGSWEQNPLSNLATTGGSGTGLRVNVTYTGGYASAIAIDTAGTGYLDGELITVTSGSSSASFTIAVTGTINWRFGTDGNLTFPDATVQTTAYLAPTTGNNVISSAEPLTISRNGMTIRVTSAGMIQMSFNSVINITGRSSINNADSVVISSPNGVTTANTQYNIGAVLALGDHLTATIVDHSFHRIYRLTVIIRSKDTTPGLELVVAYAIIEQIQ
jgi:hypothetical protein